MARQMGQKKRVRRQKEVTKAVAYLRTSSAANVGTEKDSDKRQREAIQRYADGAGIEIVDWFYDEAVTGSTAKVIDKADQDQAKTFAAEADMMTRPGFSALLDRIEGNGVRMVLVEDASRLARDTLTAEIVLLTLIKRSVAVYASNGDNLTETDDPMKNAMRQIAGVFSELEKRRLVGKLRIARDRRSENLGRRIEGRRGFSQTHPEAVLLAKKLRRASPKTGERRSLREISDALEDAGYLNERGQPFNPKSVKAMIEGPRPKK